MEIETGGFDIKNFDCAVFDGHYVTGDIDNAYLQRLDEQRNDNVKLMNELANEQAQDTDAAAIGLHNDAS